MTAGDFQSINDVMGAQIRAACFQLTMCEAFAGFAGRRGVPAGVPSTIGVGVPIEAESYFEIGKPDLS